MKTTRPIRDLGQLQTRIRVLDVSHFEQETWRQEKYRAHKDTETIFLRHWDRERMTPRSGEIHLIDFSLLEDYRQPLEAILEELRAFYRFIDYAALITNLKPGGVITPHTDNGRYFGRCHRLHIPIETNEAVWFSCGNQTIHMELDHAYEIGNVNHVHSVANRSNLDRHHLIIDLVREQ